MKTFLMAFLFVLNLHAIEWKSYEEAKALQTQNNKLIMLDVVRTNCRYCEDMERDVFNDGAMGAWIEERFIPVKLNLDRDTLPLGLKVSFTPSFFFIDKQNVIKKKIPGAWNIEDFQSMTKELK
ncbi:MAG: thioredoxin family protein [Sulfurimonadaceae bacterium]